MCEVIYKPENLDRQTSLEWAGILGDENLPPRGEKGWSEIDRGEGTICCFRVQAMVLGS